MEILFAFYRKQSDMENNFEQEIILNEEKINRLVETRGIGATNYTSAIDDIADYVENYIMANPKNTEDKNGWSFDVSLTKTKNIQIFKELHIHVNVTDIGDEKLTIGKGSGDSSVYPKIYGDVVDGKYVYPLYITINCYSNGAYLYRQTFLGILYHELNHLIEQLKRAKANNQSTSVYNQTLAYNDAKTNFVFSNNQSVDKLIKSVIYRLFSSSELNALTSEVFGELKALNSVRKNWSTDIQQTKAYGLYKHYKENYSVLENLSDEIYYKIKQVFDNSPFQGYHKSVSLQGFKKWFLLMLKKRINELYKNIGLAASYWYDAQEDAKNIEDRIKQKYTKNINEVLDESFSQFLSTYNRLIDY